MLKAAVYVRAAHHAETPVSVERQEAACREYAAKQGWDVTQSFVDNHMLPGRPAMQGLRASIENRLVDVVVVRSLDRLSRRWTDVQEFTELCEECDVFVASVNEGYIDLSTPLGRMLVRMLAHVQMYEAEQSSRRRGRRV